jgi:hypothetical protein
MNRNRTWFGVFGAAIAWLAHLLLAALVAEWGCIAGWGEIQRGGVTVIVWVIAGLTLVTMILAITATWTARRSLNHLKSGGERTRGDEDTNLFLARTGYRAGLMFIVIIIAQAIPILFYLTEC